MLESNRSRGVPLLAVMVIGFSLAASLPVIVVWYLTFNKLLEKEFSIVNEHHLLIAEGISADLELYFKQVTSALKVFAPKIAKGAQSDFATEIFRGYGFRSICVFDNQSFQLKFDFLGGKLGCPATLSGVQRSLVEEFGAKNDAEPVSFSGVITSAQLAPQIFAIQEMETNIVVSAIATTYFQSLQRAVKFGKSGHAAIVDQFGRIVAHPRSDWEFEAKDISKLSIIQELRETPPGVTEFYSPAFGVNMIAGYAYSPAIGWGVIVPQSVSDLEDFARDSFETSGYILFVGLFFAFSASAGLSFLISRPIGHVVEAAAALSAGKMGVKVEAHCFSRSIKEIDGLRTGMNYLSAQIEKGRLQERDLLLHAEENVRIAKLLTISERELRLSAEGSIEQRRLEAIGRLVGGVAHDFNNLLTVIIGNLELLQMDLEQAELQEFAEQAKGAAVRGASLTSQLLAFGRRSHLEPKNLEINKLLDRNEKMIFRVLPSNISVIFNISPDTDSIYIDENFLQTAILNLVLNAVDAMPNGGKLIFSACNFVCENGTAAKENLGLEVGDYVIISVTDQGTGMDDVTKASAFEPFFTTKPVGKGTGLGLSMVQGFSNQSGGACEITSIQGEGATVKLYLPAGSKIEPKQNAPSAWEVKEAVTILIVEDEPDVLSVISRLVGRAGYNVVSAFDGHSAIEHISKGLHPEILLTDIVMPGGMLGPELARIAVDIIPDLKVLFMSGYPEAVSTEKFSLSETAILLRKPISATNLLAEIQKQVEELKIARN